MDYDMAKSNAQSLADRWNKAVYIAKSYLTGDYCLLSDNEKPSITFRVVETVTPHTYGYNVDIKDGKIKKALDKCKAESHKQKPCVDTVSRQAVSDFLEDHAKDFDDVRVRMAFKAASSLVENADNVPSVTSARKKGKWLDRWDKIFLCEDKNCSICGFLSQTTYNYCPNCGAEMENVE